MPRFIILVSEFFPVKIVFRGSPRMVVRGCWQYWATAPSPPSMALGAAPIPPECPDPYHLQRRPRCCWRDALHEWSVWRCEYVWGMRDAYSYPVSPCNAHRLSIHPAFDGRYQTVCKTYRIRRSSGWYKLL